MESTNNNLTEDLKRLSRFGANISDSHSCFIFLPSRFLQGTSSHPDNGFQPHNGSHPHNGSSSLLSLIAFHSLSNEIIENCQISYGNGLVGWVATHARSIHVSPFEHDSRTLGMYRTDQKLKSFIGIPIKLFKQPSPGAEGIGVVACDSKKAYAFSKLQGKLLDDLSAEIANTIHLHQHPGEGDSYYQNWEEFLQRGYQLIETLGATSTEVLRFQIPIFSLLEKRETLQTAIEKAEGFHRLIEQAVPPHFPLYVFPNGDFVLVTDRMMSGFCENKIRALFEHLTGLDARDFVHIGRNRCGTRKYDSCNLVELINVLDPTEAKEETMDMFEKTKKAISF